MTGKSNDGKHKSPAPNARLCESRLSCPLRCTQADEGVEDRPTVKEQSDNAMRQRSEESQLTRKILILHS